MTELELQELNYYFSGCLKLLKINDQFLLNNILSFANLSDNFLKYVDKFDLEDKSITNNLTWEDVYLLSREIIESIDPKYLYEFDMLIKDGILNFDSEGITYFSYFNGGNSINDINIKRKFNYTDVITLIHEFFHYINLNSNRNKGLTINRYLLTEFISNYFGTYAQNYLIEKGISKGEINYNQRLSDAKQMAISLNNYIVPLFIYEKFEIIDETSLKLANEYCVSIEKDTFDQQCLKILEWFRKVEKKYRMKILYKEEFNEGKLFSKLIQIVSSDYRYLLGDLFHYYAIDHCDIKDMIYLNDHVNDGDLNIVELLKLTGLDLESDDFFEKVFHSIGNYLNKVNGLDKVRVRYDNSNYRANCSW